jgi:tetratricopeptide (TPR) repeat protein
VRQVQASAALNRAVALNPRLAEAHLELGRLYLSLNCLDLAVEHLRAYRDTPARWGGPRKGSDAAKALESELEQLTKSLDRERREYAKESEKASVSDRALMAARRGLVGDARDLLLKSDVSAFGAAGTELELELLLRTGRPDDVLEWMTPEVRGSLGDAIYQWLRARALAAAGEYDDADAQLAVMIGPGGRLPVNAEVAFDVARLTGKAVLDAQTGLSPLPQLVWGTGGQVGFWAEINEMSRALARRADMTVLRGVLALEAGYVDRAREHFRAALAFSPNRLGGAGQLAFNGRVVAWDCLSLIDP